MTKKLLAISLAVLMVLLSACSTIHADEKESGEEIQTVSFPAGNETESLDSSTAKTEGPTGTAESMKPTEPKPEESSSAVIPQPESSQPEQEDRQTETTAEHTTTPPPSESTEAEPPVTTPPTTVPQEPKPTEPPATTPTEEPTTTPEPEPTKPPEPEKPKSAYDYAFDVGTIKQELISIGTGMGLTVDGSLTPSNSSWANPVTASEGFQGSALERSLKDYVRSMPSVITAFGGEPIQYFSIYVEDLGGGSYCFYFLY